MCGGASRACAARADSNGAALLARRPCLIMQPWRPRKSEWAPAPPLSLAPSPPTLLVSDLCRALAANDPTSVANEAVDLVAGKMMSWPTDKVLPAIDMLRALLIDPKVAGRKGQAAMGAYSMAYAGQGGPTPDKIAAAQQQDIILRIIMSAASSDGPPKAAPPAPVVRVTYE